ncbi:MAG: sigma-70 family RNA polymerase sigma factor [Candidatus Magasanikbacteria bacterium]|nr:sigma-70 family RNA polymerase sigma factor [Candidatus Magasanikbacteria bacterium]
MPWEDTLLLYKIRVHKDKDAFGKVYDRYVAQVYRFVFFKLNNKEEAEDVVSEVFLKTWQYMTAQPIEVKSIQHLLYRIARNQIVDVYRRRARRPEDNLEAAAELASAENIEQALAERQTLERTIQEIKKLKQEYQEVIFLRYVEELSIREIAMILGKNGPSVRVLLHRAIKKLQSISGEPQN